MRRDVMVTPESAAVVERLAREQAWARFLGEALFSLEVWRLDPGVRDALEAPTDWLGRCRDELDALVSR